jgi:hypothetical protein
MADILEVEAIARLLLTENGVEIAHQIFAPQSEEYTVEARDRVTLAAAMGAPQQASLGDIGADTPGKHLIVQADQQIKIGVNSSTELIDADGLFLFESAITTLYFQNTDATNTVSVRYLVVA